MRSNDCRASCLLELINFWVRFSNCLIVERVPFCVMCRSMSVVLVLPILAKIKIFIVCKKNYTDVFKTVFFSVMFRHWS